VLDGRGGDSSHGETVSSSGVGRCIGGGVGGKGLGGGVAVGRGRNGGDFRIRKVRGGGTQVGGRVVRGGHSFSAGQLGGAGEVGEGGGGEGKGGGAGQRGRGGTGSLQACKPTGKIVTSAEGSDFDSEDEILNTDAEDRDVCVHGKGEGRGVGGWRGGGGTPTSCMMWEDDTGTLRDLMVCLLIFLVCLMVFLV